MYEQQFGLKKRPFLAKATGNNVFIGPQTAKTISGLKKALVSKDAVVAVSGPPGAGKTTLVARSLDALSATHTAVRIGRMQLEGTDVLEFMLEELGTTELPKGTIRRFTALREKLNQLEADGKQVVVVIEDAMRAGAETLAELEALTATDAGDSGGAAIVLMGDYRLIEFLKEPPLARLNQRIRQRHSLEPLRAAELRAYLMHCFRLAGTDFEQIFDERSANLVHELSKGIPRVANNLVESTMTSAAAAGIKQIPASFVADVARQEFSLEATDFHANTAAAVQKPAPAITDAENLGQANPESEDSREPITVFSDGATADEEFGGDDVPELIQDTLPDLEILVPNVVTEENIPELTPEPELNAEPVLEVDPQPDPKPGLESFFELEAANSPHSESSAEDVPEWERDPTLAQLRPDLDALEEAMAHAQRRSTEEPEVKTAVASNSKEPEATEASDEIPEITLDNAIQSGIENILIDEPGQISPNAPQAPVESTEGGSIPEVKLTPRNAKKADDELERIAAELLKAKAIEETDDKLAENIFGEEVDLAAAQFATAPTSSGESANDDELPPFDTAATQMAQAGEGPTVEVLLETRQHGGETGLNIGASQRLQTVRALNANLHRSLRQPENAQPSPRPNDASQPSFDTPAPIEDQMKSSMTQTLKALNVKPPISERASNDAVIDDEEQEPKKTGFFGRFKRY
jgi:type II secretory pathway predicted ATPase ExeA